MKVSYKSLLHLVSGLLIGVFVGSLIVKHEMVFEHFGAISGTIGTVGASVVALYIAHRGWKKAEQTRYEDIKRSELQRRESLLRIEYNNALHATYYFRNLARITSHMESKRPEFQSDSYIEKTIDEVMRSWDFILKSQHMTTSLNTIANWKNYRALDSIHLLLTTLAVKRNSASYSLHKLLGEQIKALSDLLYTFWYVSHSNCVSLYIEIAHVQNELNPALKSETQFQQEINKLTKDCNDSDEDAEKHWLKWKQFYDKSMS